LYCIVVGEDKPCIDREAEMEELKIERSRVQEQGQKDIEMVSGMVKTLTDFLDRVPSSDVLDRINDACGHMRKAVILMKKAYRLE
jgi:hypothetical protein